jgi:hypothetical protein
VAPCVIIGKRAAIALRNNLALETIRRDIANSFENGYRDWIECRGGGQPALGRWISVCGSRLYSAKCSVGGEELPAQIVAF